MNHQRRLTTILVLTASMTAGHAWAAPPAAATPPSDPPAAATPPSDAAAETAARALYTQGMTAYGEQRFFDAARAFDAAHAALPRPTLLLNAARAWEQVGDLTRAVERYDTLRRDAAAPEALRTRAETGYQRVLEATKVSATQPVAPEQPRGEPTASAQEAATETTRPQGPPKDASNNKTEWLTARLMIGMAQDIDFGDLNGFDGDDFTTAYHGEAVLMTLLWDHGYWEVARLGTGMPLLLTWGMAGGYRHTWAGGHEIRAGVHITNYIIIPTLSGPEVTYLYEASNIFKVEVGLRAMAWPTAIFLSGGVKF